MRCDQQPAVPRGWGDDRGCFLVLHFWLGADEGFSAMKVPMVVIHAAQVAHAKYYPLGPFASVTIAQWAIESGWGQFLSGKNNYFGIKATHEEIAAGNATLRWTHETFNGVYHPIQQWFANYDSIDDCFIAHARLLSTSQYYWKAREATTPDQYAMALQGIYATGIPGHPYGEVLINVMKNNLLYAYDLAMKGEEPNHVD